MLNLIGHKLIIHVSYCTIDAPPPCSYNRYSWLKYTLNIIWLSKVLMLKQGKFLGPNVNMNYTKLHEIGNLQMKCKQSL